MGIPTWLKMNNNSLVMVFDVAFWRLLMATGRLYECPYQVRAHTLEWELKDVQKD